MQDVTSFVNSANPLSLAPTSGSEAKKGSSEKASDAKSFMAIMLAQIADEKTAKSTTKVTKETIKKDEIEPLKGSTKEAKSVDEHLLEDLLKIASAFKNGTTATVFPTLKSSSRLEKILNSETALKELGNVKSIGDLMSLSKKYDLGLEKISFSKESLESLQKAFPALTKSNFFEHLKQEVETQQQPEETQKVEATAPTSINPLEKNVKKSETPSTPSVLKELMSQESAEPKNVKIEPKETPKHVKESDAPKIETPATIISTLSKEVKISEASVESKKTSPTPIENGVQKAIVSTAEDIKMDKKVKVETPIPTATQLSAEEAEVEVKAPVLTTRIVEPKTENAHAHKGMVESVLQTIKVEKPITQVTPEQETITVTPIPQNNEETHKTEAIETKTATIEIKTVQKQEITTKQALAPKESLNQFANDLREKIENYKPPVMKVELALFPKSLGEVDVTLLTRGNNLHVNITSNTSTMTLFTQNQAEFKNALVNMGFTNLEMNFSDQRNKEQQHNNKNSTSEFFDELSEEALNDTTTVELVVPRYV